MIPKATHTFQKVPNEFYVEPAWVSARLFKEYREVERIMPVLDPFCGIGRILDSAKKYGLKCIGLDKVERDSVGERHSFDVLDFFEMKDWPKAYQLVSNPPFKPWRDIVRHADKIGCVHCTLLLPYNALFGMANIDFCKDYMPAEIFRISPRPPMPPGHMILNGYKPRGARVDFVWIRWNLSDNATPIIAWSDIRK
jgi:hypothetical protein